MSEKEDKYHVRTLREIDKYGREISTRIVYDLDEMLRDHGLLPPKEDKKQKGELVPFPK